MKSQRPVCISVGTSDSSGCAGIQADIKTFAAMGCHGASVLVAANAQSLTAIRDVHILPPDFVRAQLDAVTADCTPAAVKIGLCPSAGAIRILGRWLRERPTLPLVVDPVTADSRGIPMLQPEAIEALCRELLPRATLITPNRFQAASLTGTEECLGQEAMESAAQLIFARYGCPTLVTGGGLQGECRDVLAGIDGLWHVGGPQVANKRVRGRGTTYSAAITAALARGESLREAIVAARCHLAAAIAGADRVVGDSLTPLWHVAQGDPQSLG